MSAHDLLATLETGGALLKVEGVKLFYRLPRALGHLRPDISKHRAELVDLLTTQAAREASARYRERWGTDANVPTIRLFRWVVYPFPGASPFTAEELMAKVEAAGGHFELEHFELQGEQEIQLVVWVPEELASWTAPLQQELRRRHAELIDLVHHCGYSPRVKLARLLRSRFGSYPRRLLEVIEAHRGANPGATTATSSDTAGTMLEMGLRPQRSWEWPKTPK